jgi:hypothetical protein
VSMVHGPLTGTVSRARDAASDRGKEDRNVRIRKKGLIGVNSTGPTRTIRRRVYSRAARAWNDGKPHTAWEILADAGMADHWPYFQREAFRSARQRYLSLLPRSE